MLFRSLRFIHFLVVFFSLMPAYSQKMLAACQQQYPHAGCFDYSAQNAGKVTVLSNPNQTHSTFYKNVITASLSDMNFEKADLREAILLKGQAKNSNFKEAQMRGLVAHHIVFDKSNFSGVDFRGAKLYMASFKEADLTNADFTEADLTLADLRGAKIDGAKFKNTTLFGTKMPGDLP